MITCKGCHIEDLGDLVAGTGAESAFTGRDNGILKDNIPVCFADIFFLL